MADPLPSHRATNEHVAEVLSRTAIAHRGVMRDAMAGMEGAKATLKRSGVMGWWNREAGNIIGDLDQIVAELEVRGIPKYSWMLTPRTR